MLAKPFPGSLTRGPSSTPPLQPPRCLPLWWLTLQRGGNQKVPRPRVRPAGGRSRTAETEAGAPGGVFCGSVVRSLSRVRLFWESTDCNSKGSSVHGISQARIPEWVAISSSRGYSLTQRSNPSFLHRQAGSLPLSHQRSPSAAQGTPTLSARLPSLRSESTYPTLPERLGLDSWPL